MKVALLTDSDVFAGTERHMLELAHGLRDAGVDVRLVCPVPSALAERAAGIPVVKIQNGGLLDVVAIYVLVKLLKTGSVDLLHSHNGRTALLAAIAVKIAGCGRAVATQHFLEPNRLSRRGLSAHLSRAAHRWVNGQTSRFIAISQAARSAMLARGDEGAETISVVPNGMPLPDLAQLADPRVIRADLGVAPHATLIVSVARLEKEKSMETLIAAMKIVVRAEPSAVCVIAGEGSQREALLAQISAAGLNESVKLVGFQSDALALIRAADLFVLPSRNEPFGLVLIEAMSVGKPVIATRAGGPLETVVEGETGLLVAPSSAEEMGGAILALARDADLRSRMGSASRAHFLEHFTVERMTRATIKAYETSLAQCQTGAPAHPQYTMTAAILEQRSRSQK